MASASIRKHALDRFAEQARQILGPQLLDLRRRGSVDHLREAIAAGTLRFHPGRLRGAYPHIPCA